ncbi:MAG TPA: Na+/H+ antiporter NhaC family protein [Candidatus Butyricicoccus avistercoris]|uniref:Na+/H+ antiporter NhaC family protein n=1 Tax=Candidatus Butyricicoccus avistercoris TaxID=2838518 RepID=A0A9D1PJE3_9FIRM|nr:Na+/H+ antiporter NhaC family protein [Candidatus Butyricicoccus avistercoris]
MKKGNAWALTPIIVFLVLFIGYGIWNDNDFYKMPAIAGFVTALVVAFLLNRKVTFHEKLEAAAKGMADENVMIMCLVFVMAGAFSGAVNAAGGADSTVNFGLSILPSNVAVVGVFLIGCFISTSMGTSVGTITVLSPIAIGIAEKTGFPVALCLGAAVCGAMFGDNLSMISDTTIAATRTQGCDMKDKFRENIKLVLPAAIITIVILFVKTMGSEYQITENLHYDIVRILPYLVVLIGALIGANVIMLLAGGTVLSLGVGLYYGDFGLKDIFTVMGNGITSMYDITVISIIVAGVVALIRMNGGIDWILYVIRKLVRGKKGAEVGIAALSAAVDCATANNTIAIVIAGPVAKEIAEEYGIEPKRTASLLDIFTSVCQGLIPYGAQILTAVSFTVGTALEISPVDLIAYCYYPMLMAVSALAFIIIGKKKA